MANSWTGCTTGPTRPAAGMDMTLALIAELIGQQIADDLANRVEYDWHRDPAWDPFADLYEL